MAQAAGALIPPVHRIPRRAAGLFNLDAVGVEMPVTQPPSTDPYVRSYRIRLLPWVVTIRRCSGTGGKFEEQEANAQSLDTFDAKASDASGCGGTGRPPVGVRPCRCDAAVRLPAPVAHRRTPLGFTMRSTPGASQCCAEGRGISRFPNKVLARVRRVSDRAGPCQRFAHTLTNVHA